MNKNFHTFHIPVMGISYTIDTPVKVARFGISSVISIVQDNLIERMREYYYKKNNNTYHPIETSDPDYRSKRITDYLNLLNQMVQNQIDKLKNSSFEPGSDLILYFEMLPEDNFLKKLYKKMKDIHDSYEKKKLQQELKEQIQAGSIDVNIMTKVDNNQYLRDGSVVEDGSDAITALKGYSESNLENSSVIFSAGMNPRLFNYLENLSAFTDMKNGNFTKKIIIKVSDYRSAMIQGKYLAKKGLWVSEFRIESGLNCGGHAFASQGYMLGPILEEFKEKRVSLTEELFSIYSKALSLKEKFVPETAPEVRITVQGGIGTHEENELLHNYYKVDATGWGSPFLLVPEAVSIDDETLEALSRSTEKDIYLSKNSPLGVPFNYLKNISGEKEKYSLAEGGKPGSPCTEKLLKSDTEFTKRPICTASVSYIRQKIKQISKMDITQEERRKKIAAVLTKECLCAGLSNAALRKYDLSPVTKEILGVTICPGPNIAYFDKIVSLKEMVDHIYGRTNILKPGYRPHMFIKELHIYVKYLKEQFSEVVDYTDKKIANYYEVFCQNMQNAVEYYQSKVNSILTKEESKSEFVSELKSIENEINKVLQSVKFSFQKQLVS
ncbi:hypothetical protein O2K51_09605 [Apibacter raozihei]|uniref:hypothetical protein n=1 Tax=Apibacter TaxID=1778601 RepID=UPI000FE306AE|nr:MULTISPECIES: hypothetical protein [Apibacter]